MWPRAHLLFSSGSPFKIVAVVGAVCSVGNSDSWRWRTLKRSDRRRCLSGSAELSKRLWAGRGQRLPSRRCRTRHCLSGRCPWAVHTTVSRVNAHSAPAAGALGFALLWLQYRFNPARLSPERDVVRPIGAVLKLGSVRSAAFHAPTNSPGEPSRKAASECTSADI
jgi:hypothetical protein